MNSELTALETRTLNYLGFKGSPDEEQIAMVRKAIEEVRASARPSFTVKYFSIKDCPIDLNFKSLSDLFIKSGSDSVCFMISTLGQSIDNRIDRLKDSDPAKMVLFDAASNAYIEEVTNEYQKKLHLNEQTFRFAPGYGDVPLSLQKQIFDNIPEISRMGLVLDDGFLMHPFKSMTGIIGFKSC